MSCAIGAHTTRTSIAAKPGLCSGVARPPYMRRQGEGGSWGKPAVSPVRGHNVHMARVILGVTGGIAAYKTCELCRLLVKAGHEVTPVLTADAERFVTAHTFEALAWRESPRELNPHLLDADLLVIAPL